jgi:hypothetical protein
MSDQASRRQWVLACGERYWPRGAEAVAALPMPSAQLSDGDPGELAEIALPDWASDLGVDGTLLAFSSAVAPGEEAEAWQRCDWIAVVWHMLAGSAEREHEARHGPVLSYAFRLPRTHHRLFDSAWANRTFLFLRRWAARERGLPEEALFGPLPAASIVLTHDVDAIGLTPEIRAKQTAFQLANGARAALRGESATMGARLRDAARFAFSAGDFRTLGKIREMEQAAGLRSILHFYGGPAGLRRGSPRRLLIDPGYDIASPYLRAELAALRDGGWTIGLHQSFGAWENASRMQAERTRVADAAGGEVVHCRQHWLHFSWERTWAAQEAAGLAFDSTLGFNDRPGFRAGHALRFHPWDFSRNAPMRLAATPMIFMDSHFYDYGGFDRSDVAGSMKRWLDEVRAVRGEATVNWHNHTITKTYGWGAGYEDLLGLLS